MNHQHHFSGYENTESILVLALDLKFNYFSSTANLPGIIHADFQFVCTASLLTIAKQPGSAIIFGMHPAPPFFLFSKIKECWSREQSAIAFVDLDRQNCT